MKKLTLKQHWLIATIPMYAGLIISTVDIMTNFYEWNWGPVIAAVVLVLGGYAYHLAFVKCPHCGGRLPSKTRFPEQCDKCGGSLKEFNK